MWYINQALKRTGAATEEKLKNLKKGVDKLKKLWYSKSPLRKTKKEESAKSVPCKLNNASKRTHQEKGTELLLGKANSKLINLSS